MSHVEGRRARLSIRSLMIAVAISATVLTPLAWLLRRSELQRQIALMAVRDAERARALGAKARAEALRVAYAARIQAANQARIAEVEDAPVLADGGSSKSGPRPGLWAALRVNHAVFRRAGLKDLDIEFSLVNDGDSVVDPRLADSQILINGKALDESRLILSNGPRDARSAALPPGDVVRFVYALGDYFKTPGIYRVSWRGAGFRSPDVVFRVLPDERPRDDAGRPADAPP